MNSLVLETYRKYNICPKNKERAIYIIKNNKNNKVYIGQTINIANRIKTHFSGVKRNSKTMAISRAILKYGIESFSFDILEFIPDFFEQDYINEREVFFISLYDSMNQQIGYNIRHGGSNGKLSEDTKAKMSKALTGKRFADERKTKYSQMFAGKNNPRYGCNLSDETKEKIRQTAIGRVASDTTKAKMSSKRKGVPKTDIHKMKIGAAHIGRKLSEESKSKISKKRKKRIINIDTGIIYDSAIDASIALGIGKHAIYKALIGASKTGAGYRWAYVD